MGVRTLRRARSNQPTLVRVRLGPGCRKCYKGTSRASPIWAATISQNEEPPFEQGAPFLFTRDQQASIRTHHRLEVSDRHPREAVYTSGYELRQLSIWRNSIRRFSIAPSAAPGRAAGGVACCGYCGTEGEELDCGVPSDLSIRSPRGSLGEPGTSNWRRTCVMVVLNH